MSRRVKVTILALLLALLLGVSVAALWPSNAEHTGYPFARRVTGAMGSPLWRLSPEALERATADDVERLERLSERLDRAIEHARSKQALLAVVKVEDLDADARAAIRDVWWTFLEPMIAVDQLKDRYDGWYGIDYLKHPKLHARAFAITYGALCVQVEAGQSLLSIAAGHKLAQGLFDEAMPELGLPRGTFTALRNQLGRARDYSFVPAGAEWYATWLERYLHGGASPSDTFDARVHAIVSGRSGRAIRAIAGTGAVRSVGNKAHVLKGFAFKGWFPIQKRVAEWAGDTRVAPEGRRLIGDSQLVELKAKLRPGDVLVERRNWYVSNIGLPGFWPHAALFTGSQDDIRAAFDQDGDVRAHFGSFSEHLSRRHPDAWRALGSRDSAGHPHTVVEAVSEGVVAASLEHSCGADYVAALRPRLDPLEIAIAIDRALGWFGRPYDFNFDFATDDAIVCSELVIKAFEPRNGREGADGGAGPPRMRGLRVPWVTVAGRRAVPPTEIVRLFASELTSNTAQMEFVYFLEGREATHDAVVADAPTLAKSVTRPKWDVAQP
jgi:hypothetical protein